MLQEVDVVEESGGRLIEIVKTIVDQSKALSSGT